MMWLFIILAGLAYLLGSVSSAIIVCKAMKLPDPRTQGSKNPGATNVLRVGGRNAAAITLLGDVLKGFTPVIVAKLFGLGDFALALVGLAAVVGHMYPVFFGFSGGKGVATAIGAFLGFSIYLGAGAIIAWIIIFGIFGYVSLASLVSVLVALALTLFIQLNYFLPVAAIAGLVVWRHKENIERLKKGKEEKTKFKV